PASAYLCVCQSLHVFRRDHSYVNFKFSSLLPCPRTDESFTSDSSHLAWHLIYTSGTPRAHHKTICNPTCLLHCFNSGKIFRLIFKQGKAALGLGYEESDSCICNWRCNPLGTRTRSRALFGS